MLDWSNLILWTKNVEKMKIIFESLHPKHKTNDVVLCFEVAQTSFSKGESYCVEMLEDEEDTSEWNPKEEFMLNKFINSNPFGKFHAIWLSTYMIF